MEQIFLLFLTKYIYLTYFLINLKLLRVGFFNAGILHKNLYRLILKNILDRLRPTQSKNLSLSLNYFSNSPGFSTIFIIYLFAPLRRSSYFLLKIYCLLVPLQFLPPCSSVSNLLFVENFSY